MADFSSGKVEIETAGAWQSRCLLGVVEGEGEAELRVGVYRMCVRTGVCVGGGVSSSY